jgi:hypothetical protein
MTISPQRRHSTLDYQSPTEFEQNAWNERVSGNSEEGRGGSGERGLVSPEKHLYRAAQPLLSDTDGYVGHPGRTSL